ncbi:MAG: hypothetical protein GX826_06890, partial [Gammaproteobacteria bacterium]|nr:hypothetical protein [Gammaproteobacteria bacterium]
EDTGGVTADTLKMLGEWHITVDLSANLSAGYPYMADLLVLDDHFRNSSDGKWYYEGCRPEDAQIGGCSNAALTNNDAVGYFESPTGLQVIVLKDGYDRNTLWYILYVFKMGTNDGSGELTFYPSGANPNNYHAYPPRAFRSASRTFVQEGSGPAKQAKDDNARKAGLISQLAATGTTPSAAKSAVPSRFDRTALLPVIRQLEARLQAK